MSRRLRGSWGVAAVLAVAAAIRVVGAGHPLLPDEGYTWLVASAPSAGSFLSRLARFENTPPLLYLILSPLPTGSVWWLRLPSLVSGVAVVALTFTVVRPRLGRRGALLAALVLAVLPYAVAESDYARAYVLSDAWLMLAFWAALRVLETRRSHWWWVWALGSLGAVFSEYDAVIVLASLAVAVVWLSPGRRRRTALLALAPALGFLPWIPQLIRSLDDVDVTKAGLGYLSVSPDSVRDQLISLFLGHSGSSLSSSALRDGVLVLLVEVGLLGIVALARWGPVGRPLLVLSVSAGGGDLVLHALAAVAGVGIFDVGYLTFLLPLGAILAGAAAGLLPTGRVEGLTLLALGAVALAVGAGLAVQRATDPPDIRLRPIREIVARTGARTILTNSAVIDFYFHTRGAILDRPFNLGPGLGSCPECARPVLVIDDTHVGSGARPARSPRLLVGHYLLEADR